MSINKDSKSVGIDNGSTIGYDKLLLATGAKAKASTCQNSYLKGVYTLRSSADHSKIQEAAKSSSNIVVIGKGLTASECVASLAQTYGSSKSISLICDTNMPADKYFGYDIGSMLMNEHQKHGVKMYQGKDSA